MKATAFLRIPGLLTPLSFNQALPPELCPFFFKTTWPDKEPMMGDFFKEGILKDRATFTSSEPANQMPLYSYIRDRHFLSCPAHKLQYARQHTPFKSLCIAQNLQHHLVSRTYSYLPPSKQPLMLHANTGSKNYR